MRTAKSAWASARLSLKMSYRYRLVGGVLDIALLAMCLFARRRS